MRLFTLGAIPIVQCARSTEPNGGRDLKFALPERFGRDNTAFQVAWLYEYDIGRELQ
jgi:hypothetical protein